MTTSAERRARRRALARERLEELTDHLYQTVPWAERLVSSLGAVASRPGSPPADALSQSASMPARRVYVLALLYFPALRDDARTLMNSCNGIYLTATAPGLIDQATLGEAVKQFRAALGALTEHIPKIAETLSA